MEPFNSFLSHNYKAEVVNSFFFRLFSEIGPVQFEVDAGKTPTNVTRLERMVREADAFVGIYPFDPPNEPKPSMQALQEYSRYFRLELDLASRAALPALIFTDARYGKVLAASASVTHETFNINELLAVGPKPSKARFALAFERFADRVAAAQRFRLSERRFDKVSGLVGLLLPPDGTPGGYTAAQISLLRSMIEGAGFDTVSLPWPVVLTPRLIGQLRTFDWVVVDVGPVNLSTGMVGYLHGAFVPCMRLMNLPEGVPAPEIPALYEGVEVGYPKDIVRWTNTGTLEASFRERLDSLRSGTERISNLDEALAYFRRSTRRREPVFISYAGEDQVTSEGIRVALRLRFHEVFDYRDGKSIPAGKQWLSHIYGQMQRSVVGIPLFSSNYFANGNCMHEMEKMIALKDQGRMHLFPVKLRRGEEFSLPPAIDSTQYWRPWEHNSAEELVDLIVAKLVDDAAKGSSTLNRTEPAS